MQGSQTTVHRVLKGYGGKNERREKQIISRNEKKMPKVGAHKKGKEPWPAYKENPDLRLLRKRKRGKIPDTLKENVSHAPSMPRGRNASERRLR